MREERKQIKLSELEQRAFTFDDFSTFNEVLLSLGIERNKRTNEQRIQRLERIWSELTKRSIGNGTSER